MSEQSSVIKRLMILIIGVIIIATVAIYFYKANYHTVPLPKPININTTNQPTMGNATAKIHIVAFEDLKCGNCARFNNNLFPKIKKQYIDTGKAKYTMVNLAFIPGSIPAANAARCIYTQKKSLFFPFIKYVYAHQPPETQDWANVPKLLDFASNISGVDTEKLAGCLVASPYTTFINDNLKEARKVMNNRVATPTIYVNGMIVRPLSMKRLTTIINSVK